MKALFTSLLIFCVGTGQAALADDDAEQGAMIGYSCLGCHGIEGYRNGYPSYHVPRLGGQKRAYIETALNAYRTGTRKHPTMNAQGESLSEEDLSDVAAWLEQYGERQDAVTADSVSGIEAAQACIACHGEAGEGVAPQPPTLSGQHQDYLEHALRQYKSGARAGSVMSAFAATLSDDDIEALAAFYASQNGLFTPKKD